jgi:hypothetical protein
MEWIECIFSGIGTFILGLFKRKKFEINKFIKKLFVLLQRLKMT